MNRLRNLAETGCVLAIFIVLVGETRSGEFPSEGWMPKEETGALEFLRERPEADGRGVVVAILDTGVDPGVEGLMETSDGKVKVIDLIDATGSGDVRMGDPVDAGGGRLVGVTGRTLSLGDELVCPTGEFRLGVIAGYEKFPQDLVARLKEDRKREWRIVQGEAEKRLRGKIRAWRSKHGEDKEKNVRDKGADLEKLLEQLEELGGAEDPGPIYDCVVWNDGEHYRAVVDTDGDGDLGEETVLADYGVAQEWATFGRGVMLNFGVNIYNDGELLSVVMDSGMHGTHVAGIVAGYYPDAPEMNGVAPGAQIVSIKIGDTRLDGMETSQALSRAVLAIKRLGVDVVNMSYGEPTRTPNSGPLIEKLADLVDEEGVVFVSSAGNDGPALSTVGAPGGTTESIIGIGAAITPALAANSYSILGDVPAGAYTWSSRGPTKDGALGVDISAPGGAFSPVPQWGLSRSLRFNGTSMASPNAAGGIALILSAAKHEGIGYTAGWVKRALENSAEPIEGVDVFGQGQGILQVGAAFDVLRKLGDRQLAMPRFDVSVAGNRGIYLREQREVEARRKFVAQIKGVFPDRAEKADAVGFAVRCVISSEEQWVRVPDWMYLTGGRGQSFEIEVDATRLGSGVHYAEVVGIDADAPEAGPLFRVPVTVVKAEAVGVDSDGSRRQEARMRLGTGEIERWFLKVPTGATWARFKVGAEGIADPRGLLVHTAQVVGAHPHRNTGLRSRLSVEPGEPAEVIFPVLGDAALEVCVAPNWSVVGEVDYLCEIEFHGVVSESGSGVYGEGDEMSRLRVVATLGHEEIRPEVKFGKVRRALEASESEIIELVDPRDLQDDGKSGYELFLRYGFGLSEEGDVRISTPALDDRLYESVFESRLAFIEDMRGKVVAVDDAFLDGWTTTLPKGEWEAVLHFRSDEREKLEKLEELGAVLEIRHETTARVYGDAGASVTDGPVFGGESVEVGERVELFVGKPESIPDWGMPGDVMVGGTHLQGEGEGEGEIHYVIGGRQRGAVDKPGKSGVSSAILTMLKTLREEGELEAFDQASNQLGRSGLELEGGDLLELRLEEMRRWDSDESREEAVATSDAVIELIRVAALARYFGEIHDEGDERTKAKKDKKEREREALREALEVRVRSLAGSDGDRGLKEMRKSLRRLGRWADLAEDRYAATREAVAKREGHDGEILVLLAESLEGGKAEREHFEERIEVLERNGWGHLADREREWMVRRFPLGKPVY